MVRPIIHAPYPARKMLALVWSSSAATARRCAPASPRRADATSSWGMRTTATTSHISTTSSPSCDEGYDVVMGNRFRGGISPGAMPLLHRYLGNPLLSLIGRLFFKFKVGDFHCGLRGFNRARIARFEPAHHGHGVCERDDHRRFAAQLRRHGGAHHTEQGPGGPGRRICALGATAGATCASC